MVTLVTGENVELLRWWQKMVNDGLALKLEQHRQRRWAADHPPGPTGDITTIPGDGALPYPLLL